MTQKQIRVGIVGADTNASWAKVSHIPAIRGLPCLKLAAVATRHEQSAREAAQAFGAGRWFSDPFAMIRDEQIDLIAIAVKLPAHRELARAALAAGKAVYSEAPLGRNVEETGEMVNASFQRLLRRAGLKPMKFHKLRHTAASLALQADVPMWKASKMLGHRDITTTFRIYSHLTPEGREDVAERMEQVLRPANTGVKTGVKHVESASNRPL